MPRYDSITKVPPEVFAEFVSAINTTGEEWLLSRGVKPIKRKLVLKDSRLLKGTIDVGWRITCTDGHYDRIWGNTKNDESLKNLMVDIESKYGSVEIVDERESNEQAS